MADTPRVLPGLPGGAALTPPTWRQWNGRIGLPTGRHVEVGIPTDMTPVELLALIAALPQLAAQVAAENAAPTARILVPVRQ